MPNVCLTMIVKNEGATIRRCLRAAKPFITHWSIVDTGSTDATREAIHDELADVPGVLHEREWKNFGHNRGESFSLARDYLGASPSAWCLLLDADHEIIDDGFDRSSLERSAHPAYRMQQRDTRLTYDNVRLIRASVPARCVGVTHEYWDVPNSERITGAWILDHADGGTRHEKFERDERLLLQGLRDEPNNERYVFYLAQTYEGMRRTADAVAWYGRRAAMRGGFEEERWMAQYRRGQLLIAA